MEGRFPVGADVQALAARRVQVPLVQAAQEPLALAVPELRALAHRVPEVAESPPRPLDPVAVARCLLRQLVDRVAVLAHLLGPAEHHRRQARVTRRPAEAPHRPPARRAFVTDRAERARAAARRWEVVFGQVTYPDQR
jgi:hypothetical protein